MVQGVGHDVTDALDLTSEHLQTVEVSPWAPGPEPRLLRIDARTITGRRFAPRPRLPVPLTTSGGHVRRAANGG